MNKWTLSCVIFLLVTQKVLLATEMTIDDTYCPQEKCIDYCCPVDNKFCLSDISPILKVRVAAFFPIADRFKEIYGSSMPNYQIEAACTFFKCFQVWLNVDYLYKRGNSYHLGYYTTVQKCDLSSGVSMPYRITDNCTVYAGIGAALGFIKVHNRFTDRHQNERKTVGGLALKSGLIYDITCNYFLDLFVDYLYMSATFRTRVDVGGLKTGVGIGTRF